LSAGWTTQRTLEVVLVERKAVMEVAVDIARRWRHPARRTAPAQTAVASSAAVVSTMTSPGTATCASLIGIMLWATLGGDARFIEAGMFTRLGSIAGQPSRDAPARGSYKLPAARPPRTRPTSAGAAVRV
jgi:hypothetical protein